MTFFALAHETSAQGQKKGALTVLDGRSRLKIQVETGLGTA
jgi:hypothetical protein